MTHASNKPHVATGENVEEDAETLEHKFGDMAKTYAENRLEAAELRGADHAADHWREVENEIEHDDQCE